MQLGAGSCVTGSSCGTAGDTREQRERPGDPSNMQGNKDKKSQGLEAHSVKGPRPESFGGCKE